MTIVDALICAARNDRLTDAERRDQVTRIMAGMRVVETMPRGPVWVHHDQHDDVVIARPARGRQKARAAA